MTFDDLFLFQSLPTLDLHGLDSKSAQLAIRDFIKENQKMKKKFVVIIHGIGTGKLRKATKEVLQIDKNIEQFKLSSWNPGCTIVQIKN